jgi:NADH-quinone oxidoreductase subunit N
LLAYSAIAHAGVLLLGVMCAHHGPSGPAPLLYYGVTYGMATVGAFGVVAVLEGAGQGGGGQSLTDLAGLWRRSPLLAGCLAVFILSLAGIPPLAGFLGKFYIFAAALRIDGLGGAAGWLAILAILMSAVGLYYYLIILKQAFVLHARDDDVGPVRVPVVAAVALAVAAVLTLGLGLWPALVVQTLAAG